MPVVNATADGAWTLAHTQGLAAGSVDVELKSEGAVVWRRGTGTPAEDVGYDMPVHSRLAVAMSPNEKLYARSLDGKAATVLIDG